MYITAETIIRWAEVVGAAGAIAAVIAAVVRWFVRQARQDEDIRDIKAEQCLTSYALLACLDGLKQLGANGNVTDAHNKLEKHLNKRAHDLE